MLLSEQRLRAGSEWVAVARVGIRRRIVTETVQLTVTVCREELVFNQEPLSQPIVDPPIGQVRPFVAVLREEVPVVTLMTRPYEQVTVSVVQVAGERTVTAALDSDQVELLQSNEP